MPVQLNLKEKGPRFEGDRPSWHLVASGPVELFSTKIQRFMFMHGMNAMNDEGDFSVWTTRPSIAAPPVYLASLLSSRYGFQPKRDLARRIRESVSERSGEDGLDHFIGRSSKVNGGLAALRIEAGSQDFIANCAEDDWKRRSFLEGAGWLPVETVSAKLSERFGSRPYRTRDPFIAGNLDTFMTPNAKGRLAQALARATDFISRSKSQDPPVDFAIPSPEGLNYLPFQKGGIQRVVESGQGAIIADDMGLGKTIQGIGVLNGRPDAKRAIFFCQANMRLKWVREIEKWKINRELTVGHAEGSKFPDTDIVVINYDIAKRHIGAIREIEWDLIVTDEAHNLKNPDAQRTQAILGDLESFEGLGPIGMSANGQLVHLTGTPKPNRIAELWPLLTSSRPDLWGRGPAARQAFVDRYEPPILIKREIPSKYKNGKSREVIIPMPGKPMRELELQMRLRGSGSFIRRMKRDTDMPPKLRSPIEMPFRLLKEDQETLKQAEADLRELHARITGKKIQPGTSLPAREVIDVITGLKPGSPHFSEIARVRSNLGSLKAPHAARFIVEELEADKELSEDQRRKTVVFAHHQDVIRIMAETARKTFPNGVIVYDGSSGSAAKRQALVDSFQEDPSKRLFIMSLAGATGITLTAAYRMRVVEPDWSASNMVQIEDRIWRIGQEQACDIGYLFVPNSLDVNMGLALHAKMETDERSINTLSFRGMKASDKKQKGNLFDGDAKINIAEPSQSALASSRRKVDDAQPELPL
ncbi:DEAD/DEAH box helicase [Paracoccus sp. ME4]|uniref:DEAD/DEAH box helicase n=1 Tax=Paracoccus sp. ME4 TaxID=3138066 RepID=UPI00398AAB06